MASVARYQLIAVFLVPANVDKFGYAFAGAIRFHFKERLRLSTWIETKMFGSPPDEGTIFVTLLIRRWVKRHQHDRFLIDLF